jgi:hypothetical protein
VPHFLEIERHLALLLPTYLRLVLLGLVAVFALFLIQLV